VEPAPDMMQDGSQMGSRRTTRARESYLDCTPRSSRQRRGTARVRSRDTVDSGRQYTEYDAAYATEVLENWKHLVTRFQEMSCSEMSQLHSAWQDAKAFTIFVANPAHDERTDTLGTHFHFMRDTMSMASVLSKSPTPLLEDPKPQGNLFWRAIRFTLCLVLHPFTRYRMMWDIMGMAICLHDVSMLPAQVFEFPQGYIDFRLGYEWLSCVFWTIDIMLNFSTGFISSEGLLEMRKDKVAEHYVRTWFVPDFIITISDWCFLIISVSSSGVLRVGKAASRSLRAMRLLRMPKLNASFNQMLGAMNSESLSIVAGIAKFLLILILVTHYVACAWYWLADREDRAISWRDRYLHSDDSDVYAYFTSMHWALTQFTPASMEVVPVNVHERFFTCIVIIVALVVFSSFVSSITQAMTRLRETHSRKLGQELLMRKYFSEFQIPRELAARCKHFMVQHQRMANKRIKETDIPVMLLLPKSVREELRYEAFNPWLKSHPFFALYIQICPVGMRQICNNALDEVSMLPLEEIFWNGQSVNRMIFVRIGLVTYCHRGHLTSRGHIISPIELRKGQWACEETLWSKASRVDGPFRASSAGCELITILPAAFQSIAKVHVGPLRFCVSYAEAFVRGFNAASRNIECEDLLFNDPFTIVDLVQDACLSQDDPRAVGKRRTHVSMGRRTTLKRSSIMPRMSIKSNRGSMRSNQLGRGWSMNSVRRLTTTVEDLPEPRRSAIHGGPRPSRLTVLSKQASTVSSSSPATRRVSGFEVQPQPPTRTASSPVRAAIAAATRANAHAELS